MKPSTAPPKRRRLLFWIVAVLVGCVVAVVPPKDEHRGQQPTGPPTATATSQSPLTTAAMPVPTEPAPPGDVRSLVRDRPYVPLFTELSGCDEVRQVNALAPAQRTQRLDEAAAWFVHVHAETPDQFPLGPQCQASAPTSLGAELAARGVMVSNYRNGSYVSQATSPSSPTFGEAADLEATAPLAIATFWPGDGAANRPGDGTSPQARLALSLDASSSTVRLSSSEGAATAPPGAPRTWPYLRSRGSGAAAQAHSADTHDVVSWVRIDDELMQVIDDPRESGGVVTLSVRRGLWGTTLSPHTAGSRVLSPVYIGSTTSAASDAQLAGSPARDSTSVELRYAIKIWQPDGWGWIASRITATFGGDLGGYNTVWLDVSSCSQYNQASATGSPVSGWDDRTATRMTQGGWETAQRAKLDGLRSALPGVRLVVNNLAPELAPCLDDLITAADGGVLEHWMKNDPPHWPLRWDEAMSQHLRIQSNNWPAIYWVRWSYDFTGDPARYRRFSYGSLLLGLASGANKFQYGGPWRLNKPDQLYFWDWGTPSPLPTSIAQLRVSGTPAVYRREFANGIVLVNPGDAAVRVPLSDSFYNVLEEDASGVPATVDFVTVNAGDAAFLVRADAVG